MQNVARPFWAKNWRKIMIEELKDTEIINKVGGKFKLTALIQKRLDEMMQGGRPLIEDTEGLTHLEIVIQEILQDKITIDRETDRIKNPEK
jgi:DNA-directed RNA polymerase subunit omega